MSSGSLGGAPGPARRGTPPLGRPSCPRRRRAGARGTRRGTRPDSGLDVRQLRAFVALVDCGSVSAAAESLGLAQSTVSESLATLERALGTTVAVRRRGG